MSLEDKLQQNRMENIKSQTFTEEQLKQDVKSTYDQSIKQYSRLTKSKKHQQELSLKVGEALTNESHTIENVAAN